MIRSIAEAPTAFHATAGYSRQEGRAWESQDTYAAIQKLCIDILNRARSRNMTSVDLQERVDAMTGLLHQKLPLTAECRRLVERTRKQLRDLQRDNEFLPELERREPRP